SPTTARQKAAAAWQAALPRRGVAMSHKKVPGWLSGLLIGGAFCGLLWLEQRRPLRRSVEPKFRRNARNLAVAALSAAAVQLAEMVVSVPWRAAQVVGIGVSPLSLSVWQTATLVEILFHHSNVELPVKVERWLCRFLVTPRMHGIHHSLVPEETGSNWSSGLTLWDWLHGTLRLNVPQEAITIGVPAYRVAEEVTLPHILIMPFGEQPDSWRLPRDGRPSRVIPWGER